MYMSICLKINFKVISSFNTVHCFVMSKCIIIKSSIAGSQHESVELTN